MYLTVSLKTYMYVCMYVCIKDYVEFLSENFKETDILEHLDMDGSIILKLILEKCVWWKVLVRKVKIRIMSTYGPFLYL
jgi:hypothetical protein